jgi:G3E family GTPase
MMTPITLLTGFLGSGKTTLMNRLLSAPQERRIGVLVNDFGAINIDAQLIVGLEGEAVQLANGCICCTIRGDLLAAIEGLLDAPEPPEALLIEASGISDPAEIILTIANSRLRERTRVDGILAMLDAEGFGQLRGRSRVLAEQQVRTADMVILNKADLVDEVTLRTLEGWVRQQVPQARVLRAVQADVPLALVWGMASEQGWQRGAHDHDHHDDEHNYHDHAQRFHTWQWHSDKPLDLAALQRFLDDLPTSVYRLKGLAYVRDLPDAALIVQVAGRRASLSQGQPWGAQPPATQLVMISETEADTEALRTRLEACLADHIALTEFRQWWDGLRQWWRGRRSQES